MLFDSRSAERCIATVLLCSALFINFSYPELNLHEIPGIFLPIWVLGCSNLQQAHEVPNTSSVVETHLEWHPMLFYPMIKQSLNVCVGILIVVIMFPPVQNAFRLLAYHCFRKTCEVFGGARQR